MEKIVKSGLRDCTVTLDGSECSVKFDSCFRVFAVRNDSAADVFISKASGIVPDADGVMCVKSGASAVFAHMDIYADTVYLLGTGKVQVHAQNDTANPFNFAPTFDGGVQASGNPVVMNNLQGGVPFSEIVVSGKNLYDNSIIVGMIVSSTGEMITNTSKYLSTNGYVTVKPNEKYVLSNAENKVYDTVVFYDENKNYISSYVYGGGGIPVPRGFITPENCRYVRWRYYMNGETATVDMLTNIQLELGSTPTAYEPPITGRELVLNVNGTDYTITPDSIPYTIPDDIRQQDGLNNISVSEGELSVTGVRKNAAIKRIWDEIDEIKTAIIVSNGESE